MRKVKIAGMVLSLSLFGLGMSMTALADWSQSNGRWYYYNDSNGQLVRDDWVQSNGKWYYVDQNGAMQTGRMIDDTYYVDKNGVMAANTWIELQEDWSQEAGWRYFGSNGKAYVNGWREIGGSWYHFTDTVMDTGWQDIDGKTYYLGSSGAMSTGWRQLSDRNDDWGEFWYYFGTNGRLETDGEKKIGGETYIFDPDGRMLNGWVNPKDYTSAYGSNGNDDLSTTDVNALEYFKSAGQRADGWLNISSPDGNDYYWYYFKDGRAYTTRNKTTAAGAHYGMAKIKGDTYCFNEQGHMVTGLVEIEDGRKFYFDEDGKMKTGRVVVNDDDHDNEVFYFTTTGSLGNKGDGFTGVKDGSLYDNGSLITAEEGMRYEKVQVDGKDYVVNESGKVKTSGTVTDSDGIKYKIEKQQNGTYKIEVID